MKHGIEISNKEKLNNIEVVAIATDDISNIKNFKFTDAEINYIKKKISNAENFIIINRLDGIIALQITKSWDDKHEAIKLESYRVFGHKVANTVNTHKYKQLQILCENLSNDFVYAIAEGALLSNYQFIKYKTDKTVNTLKSIVLVGSNIEKNKIDELNTLTEAVFMARNWVNTPVLDFDAVEFAKQMEKTAGSVGIKAEILNKKQIQSLKMGGLLAVNMGSKTPPTFTILEYKPAKAKNKKPLVLVGKGVVYDTGGLSLKPTPNSMDHMKCDMAGGATVAAAIYAVAKAKLPYYVVALIPATDNRPGEIAYTPGDVITMYDGKTVEVLNTDAEGRMLLADALAYAKKYNPELVFDFATLTGAAAAAIGPFATVMMGTASSEIKNKIKETGDMVFERIAEFPFWDEYADLIKSDIADMKNIGGPIAGAITAGKFLEKFTDYPWLHFDIAGTAYIDKPDAYRPKNATGIGVRLIFNFIKQLCSN
ncbi:MAG: leucyl aminopeptidase family protein [Bacteroidia bacterium]